MILITSCSSIAISVNYLQAQYKFLHEAILEEYSSRETRKNCEQFDAVFPDTININNTSRVDKEFKAS